MYYVFLNIYIYIYRIQKNTGGLQHCLGRVMSKECFQTSTKGFDTVLSPQIIFFYHSFYTILINIYTYMYVFLIDHIFYLSMLQVRNFRILFCWLTKYVLYSLLFFHFFQVTCCSVLLPLLLLRTMVEFLDFISIVGVYCLAYPLDVFYKTSLFYMYYYLIT